MLKRIALTASLLSALALAGTAFAGNGGGSNKSSSSSISSPIVLSSASLNALTTSGPRYGDTITFEVSTTETSRPFVHLQCYQNQILVAQGWAAYFTGGLWGKFVLDSGVWTGGAADCTADLVMSVNYKWKVLASTAFPVGA
jgi:hypothetical protein